MRQQLRVVLFQPHQLIQGVERKRADTGNLLQLVLNAIELPENPDSLILPAHSGSGKPSIGVDKLPDSAQICSCFDVTKGDLIAAINKGCHTVAALKAETKAGTGCGGCIPLVTQVLNAELAKQGIEVNNNLCEHFAYSRQELFHLIRVEGIKTFEELLAKHGKGYGCEVCKPTVGSLLASCWNEYILKPEHTPLQDSNDNFLANIQKDGTYSVIPRSAGGEITPEGLVAVGRIAREFNLYTKITGSQRLAMFGAQKDDLPEIWRQLIEAGFETGHAYAKALRMAKTCVGSTWCRYGVGDSVGFGVELENRYKGIRTPHKMKFGVSGCTRECAEAQGKDVGIIATEKGWNLYVCGNGGMKPRHADLLAAEAAYCAMEDELREYLDTYEQTHDYDEYHFDLDEIKHDPYVLLSILSALHEGQFTIDQVQGDLQMLFDKQYILTETVTTETRYRTETRTDSEGNEYEVEVPYTYYICTVELENFDLSHVPVYIMDTETLSMYAVYMSTLGNRPDLFPSSGYVGKYIENPPTAWDIPAEYLTDERFATLITEAEKYLGYPYVWGGSSPETSFDCSGFVSYVLTSTGLCNTGRLGAQGLYNISTPVSDPQPGDLVFFVGTYDTSGISHVGIYVGDGMMLHCGDPISYTNLNTSYWQSHFYAYGRPPYN